MHHTLTVVPLLCESAGDALIVSCLQSYGDAKQPTPAILVSTGSLCCSLFTLIFMLPSDQCLDALDNHCCFFFLLSFLMFCATLVSMLCNLQVDSGSLFCRKEVVPQIVFYFILEDFVFYWGHRILHTKWLYQHVHSVHHE